MSTQSNTTSDRSPTYTSVISNAVFLTAKEMIAAGLSKEWAIEELSHMYCGYELSQDWFKTVIDGAAAALNFTKTCNMHSGSV
jgi:hypothetical protein